MRVAGCDFSSHAVDIVTVPFEGTGTPVWTRFPLVGADAFDRARSVTQAVPGPSSVYWDDILAVGIESPGARHPGVNALWRIQGAILARIPARMLVHPISPSSWRKLVGLPGNAPKAEVATYAMIDLHSQGVPWTLRDNGQDCLDAYCIALATRSLITTEAAA